LSLPVIDQNSHARLKACQVANVPSGRNSVMTALIALSAPFHIMLTI